MKVIFGYFATSKKSALRKWLSRISTSVSIEFTSISKVKTPSLKSSFEETMLMSKVLNKPSTSEMVLWTVLKFILACALSTFQVDCACTVIETLKISAAVNANNFLLVFIPILLLLINTYAKINLFSFTKGMGFLFYTTFLLETIEYFCTFVILFKKETEK